MQTDVLRMFSGCAASIPSDETPLFLVEPLPKEIKKQGPFPLSANFNRVFLATGAPPGAQLGRLGRGLRHECFPGAKFCDIALSI